MLFWKCRYAVWQDWKERKSSMNWQRFLKTISYLEDLLGNTSRILALIKQETNELKDKFGDERRTEINKEGIKESARKI